MKNEKMDWRDPTDLKGLEKLDGKLPCVIRSFEATKSMFFEKERNKRGLSGREKGDQTREQTKYIKNLFTFLSIEYAPYRRVYSNGINQVIYNRIAKLLEKNTSNKKIRDKVKNNEWLYDIHWYLDEGDSKGEKEINNNYREEHPENRYCPIGFQLAVECEWGNNDAVKFDFQKLLFCNANIRLMVFRSPTHKDLNSLSEYFIRAVEKYPKLCKGSKFVFIAFIEVGESILYSTYKKKNDCKIE